MDRSFCFDFTKNNLLSHQFHKLPPFHLDGPRIPSRYCCHCSVDTELIDRKNNAINCIKCVLICSEVYRHLFLLLFSWPLYNGVVARNIGCALSANFSNISSAIWSQAPCGLFSDEYHFFSEPGPINDHCPIPNLPANVFTNLAFFKHSSLLSFLSQEMSLNIDIKRILPVKVSGVCPRELSRSLILSQSCNVVNPGKMFHSNSVDSPLIAS